MRAKAAAVALAGLLGSLVLALPGRRGVTKPAASRIGWEPEPQEVIAL